MEEPIGSGITGMMRDLAIDAWPHRWGLAMILAGTALLIVALPPKQAFARLLRRLPDWGAFLAANYVKLVFAMVALVCLWAAWIGLLRVPLIVGAMPTLRVSTTDAS